MITSLLAELSDLEIIFLTQKCTKANFNRELTLDIQMYFKEMETFQYLNFHSCHSPGTKRGFLRGEVLCLPWINLSHFMFNINMWCFKICWKMEFLRNVLLNLIAPGEKGYSKTNMGYGFYWWNCFLVQQSPKCREELSVWFSSEILCSRTSSNSLLIFLAKSWSCLMFITCF